MSGGANSSCGGNYSRALGPGRLEKADRSNGRTAWTFTWTDAVGVRQRRVLSSDKRVAEQASREIIRQRDLQLAGLGMITGQERTLADLRDAYLADLEMRVCPNHFVSKRFRLDKALRLINVNRIRQLTHLDAVKLQSALVREGLSHTTVNMSLGSLQSMLNWAVRMRLIAENPIEHVERLPQNERHLRVRRRAMTEEEIVRFVEAACADDRTSAEFGYRVIPQAIFWRTLLETGMRFGEARKLTWADIDFDRNMLNLRGETTKSAKPRSIPLHPEFVADLAGLHDTHRRILGRDITPGEPVFLLPRGRPLSHATNNANRTLQRILLAAGIARVDENGRKIDIHALRHTFGTRLARNGAPLAQTQLLMGHSDPKLTARVYVHMEAEDTRAAVEALPRTAAKSVAAKLRRA